MPNKIKDIFSDDMFNINGTLRFSNDEAYQNFLAALEIAYAEGHVVPVNGVTSITTTVNHLGITFPLGEQANITEFFIGPAVEPFPISLEIEGTKNTITLLRSQTKDKIILCSEPHSIVSFQFVFFFSENTHTLKYDVQFDNAKTIKEIADSFSIAAALLDYFYKQDNNVFNESENNKVSLSNILEYFFCYKSFFKRLYTIEGKLGLSIKPCLLNNLTREEQQDIDELYLLLCENKTVRLNAILSESNSTVVFLKQTDSHLNIGSKISLTFLGTIEFFFLEQTVILHTANLLVNAIIKDVQKCDDGETKILYGDTDSAPMYIALSAFQTEEEAKQESGNIMEHDDIYINALTVDTYIKQFYKK
jgi:hypothetical protein